MGLFDRIKQKASNKLIDSIEWTDTATDILIWRSPCYQKKIKATAQLTVRENQIAVLVNGGQLADVYQPGCYELTTRSMPILTMLKGWKYSFNSPFKADVYFVNTKQFLNLSWATTNSIMLRDSKFGSLQIGVNGCYSFQIALNPVNFIRNVVGTDGNFTAESVIEQLLNFVITKFAHYLAQSKIAAQDLAANLNEFSNELTIALKHDFSEIGIELIEVLIENISLPKVVEEALFDKLNTTINH